jgi:hypothetical protein
MAQIICLRLVFQYADIYRDNNKIVNIPRPPVLSFLVPGTSKFQEELEIKSEREPKTAAYSMSLLLDNDKNTYTV